MAPPSDQHPDPTLVLNFHHPELRYGYYTEFLRPGFRIVSINSNFCNDENFWILTANGDPGHQHRWLIETLQSAEENFQNTLRLLAHAYYLSQEVGPRLKHFPEGAILKMSKEYG